MSVSHGTTRSSPTGTPRDHQASARAAATTAAAVRPAGAQCHDADSLHDPLPRRGRGMRKRGPYPTSVIPARCSPHGSLPDPPAAPVCACPHPDRLGAAQADQRERNATAKAVSIPAAMQWLVRARPLSFPRACRARARNPGFRCRARGIPGSADAARAKRYDSPRGSCTRESPAKRAGSGRGCHYNIQLPIGP